MGRDDIGRLGTAFRSCTLVWVLATGSAMAAPANTGLAARAVCDDDDFQTLLQAVPPGAGAGTDAATARGYWLTRQLLQWPGVQASGRFALYHSAHGRIVANQGAPVTGADGMLPLDVHRDALPEPVAARFKFVGDGVVLTVRPSDLPRLPALHKGQLVLVQEDAGGRVRKATALQTPGALDDFYASAGAVTDLGVNVAGDATGFKLWAPTARAVSVCLYDAGRRRAVAREPMRWDAATGV